MRINSLVLLLLACLLGAGAAGLIVLVQYQNETPRQSQKPPTFSVSAHPAKEVFALGEPVLVNLSVTNLLAEPQKADLGINGESNLQFYKKMGGAGYTGSVYEQPLNESGPGVEPVLESGESTGFAVPVSTWVGNLSAGTHDLKMVLNLGGREYEVAPVTVKVEENPEALRLAWQDHLFNLLAAKKSNEGMDLLRSQRILSGFYTDASLPLYDRLMQDDLNTAVSGLAKLGTPGAVERLETIAREQSDQSGMAQYYLDRLDGFRTKSLEE